MNNPSVSMESASKLDLAAKASHGRNESAYGGYEQLKSQLIEEEELSGLKMEDEIVANTDILIVFSGGNGNC
mgnify:CR=1 FL=1